MSGREGWVASTHCGDSELSRLLLLGDALAAAGFTSEDLLAHCRSGGEHVRGYQVVDLALRRR